VGSTTAPVMAPAAFVDELLGRGYDLFTGVPCSLVKGVLRELSAREDVTYVPAPREDQALGLAAGAAMGGRRPVVIMQNSGLGVSLNALLSLHMIYALPGLVLITWRGYEGVDAPEHVIMGPAMTGILDAVGLPWVSLEPEGEPGHVREALDWAGATLAETSKPCAILVRKGALS